MATKGLCAKCEGLCCKEFLLYLVKSDLEKLGNLSKKLKIRKLGPIFIEDHTEGFCPFLNPASGCILKEEMKPFECKLFPLSFQYKNSKIKFYIYNNCTYHKKVPAAWVKKTMRWAAKELDRWTEEEKRFYSNRIEKLHFDELKPIQH